MKKILLVLAAFIVLGLGALAVFIATFDADRYRPMLVKEMERVLGKAVELQRISLAWDGGIAVQFRGLALYETAQPSGEALLRVDTVSALLRIAPLLQRRVEVETVRISRPQVRIVRLPDGQLNMIALAAMGAPAAAKGQTVQAPSGQSLSFDIEQLVIEQGTVWYQDAAARPPVALELRLVDATVRHISLTGPMDVELDAALGAPQQNVHVSGRFTPPSASFEGAFEDCTLRADQLALQQLLPAGRPNDPSLDGHIGVSLSGRVASLEPSRLTEMLSGSGTLTAPDLRIQNLNLLRAVFEQFSMLPGLADTLRQRLPPEYQTKFEANETVFRPINLSTAVEGGVARLLEFTIATDVLTLRGSGQISLTGRVDLRTVVRIDPTMSEAIFRSVQELRPLATAEGEIEIPVAITGSANSLSVQPDMNYIVSKVIASKAADLIGQLLKKQFGGEEPAGPGAATPEAQPAPPEGAAAPPQAAEGDLLNALLRRALQGQGQEQPAQ